MDPINTMVLTFIILGVAALAILEVVLVGEFIFRKVHKTYLLFFCLGVNFVVLMGILSALANVLEGAY